MSDCNIRMAVDTQSDSQETNSTSVVEDSFNISFENINYKVRDGFSIRGRKNILRDVNGHFNPGELSVIIGQSGAGKSSLMDILAGYTKPTSGRILINGRIRDEKMFRRRSCYILQDDKVQETLTIQEALTIAAELKLGNHVSQKQKEQRVNEIITSLRVEEVRNTMATHLSGGEKKRLAIGLELVHDPPIIFIDEPTSGLDSSKAKKIMRLLHLLARQGRTVVITIHQPSVSLLQMVDRLYAIVGGQCAYMGSVSLLLPYLDQFNLRCPPYHDPVDFFMEICLENDDKLIKCSRNGKNNKWLQNIPFRGDDSSGLENDKSESEDVSFTILPSPKDDPTSKVLLALKSTYATSSWKQFVVLTRRALLVMWRHPRSALLLMGIHIAMALFVGTLFWNIGLAAENIRNNYNFLYFSLMFISFTAYMAVSVNFPEQLAVIRREHFNRWYNSGAYYSSTLVSVLPVQTICTLSFTFITYYMTGQPAELNRFSIYCFTLLLVSYVGTCLGLFNGSLFSVKLGVIFGPFFIMPFLVFSGFFLRYDDAPYLVRWLYHLSFYKYGLSGLVISIFGLGRKKFKCTAFDEDGLSFCYYTAPSHFLKDNGLQNDVYETVVTALLISSCVFILCSYTVLKIRLKCKW